MKNFLYTSIIFVVLVTCSKNTPPSPDNPYGLPNATQTGAGVFACRINGANAIANLYNCPYWCGAGGVTNDTLGISGKLNIANAFDIIGLAIYRNLKINTTYSLADSINTYCRFVADSTCQTAGKVTNIYPYNGTITLTRLDTANKIISCKFAFDVPIPSGCDTLHITYGRFDYGY